MWICSFVQLPRLHGKPVNNKRRCGFMENGENVGQQREEQR